MQEPLTIHGDDDASGDLAERAGNWRFSACRCTGCTKLPASVQQVGDVDNAFGSLSVLETLRREL